MRTEPKQTKFGLIKVFLLTLPAGLFGAFVSNKGAEILEESELFVPDDWGFLTMQSSYMRGRYCAWVSEY